MNLSDLSAEALAAALRATPPAADPADAAPSPRLQRWAHYLGDLQAYAAVKAPLQTHGTLVRVTGLVLEAAGVRAPAHLGDVVDEQPRIGRRLQPHEPRGR